MVLRSHRRKNNKCVYGFIFVSKRNTSRDTPANNLFQLSWVSSLDSLRSIALCREIFKLHFLTAIHFLFCVVLQIMVWDETIVTSSLATLVMDTRKSVFWKYFLVFSSGKHLWSISWLCRDCVHCGVEKSVLCRVAEVSTRSASRPGKVARTLRMRVRSWRKVPVVVG